MRGYLRRNWLDHLAPGISETRVARMSQANWAGPPQVRAYLSLELRKCFKRIGPDQIRSEHLQSQSCDDVSGENVRTVSCAACLSLNPELQGCLRQNGPDHLAKGISEPRVARISQSKRAVPHQVSAYLSPVLRGCSREPGRTISRTASKPRVAKISQAELARPPGAWHLGAQICGGDVSGETDQVTSGSGISEARVARMSEAKLSGSPRARHV